ncbi:MAG TPA: ABC transporter permease [Candidatus Paceibacterota bacterium]|nr:ABC transporter permease [Candidatus Paceibacterota bacterium]
MSALRIYALVARHLTIYLRSIPRVMDIFFWPVMDLLILGFLSIYLNSLDIGNINIVAMLIGGVVLWQIVDRSQNAFSTYFLEDVWYRNFLNIFITPLKLSEFFVAGAILSLIRILIVSLILFLISLFLYKFSIFTFGLALVPYMINLFLFGFSLAIFINAIIIRFGASAQVLAFGMAILVQPVSAVYYPVSALPHWLQYVSYGLPGTYVFESVRNIAAGGAFEWGPFLIALVLNFVYLGLAWWFFTAMFRKVKKLGKLLKVQD